MVKKKPKKNPKTISNKEYTRLKNKLKKDLVIERDSDNVWIPLVIPLVVCFVLYCAASFLVGFIDVTKYFVDHYWEWGPAIIVIFILALFVGIFIYAFDCEIGEKCKKKKK